MASQFMIPDAPAKRTRVKRTAKPVQFRIQPEEVVGRLYGEFPEDMARLAE